MAMISSNRARGGHPSRVLVSLTTPEGQQTGLFSDSVILLDNLATVLNSEIDRTIGVCSQMAEVDTALRFTLGL